MFKYVAQEITELLADDDYERRPSEMRRVAKARLAASIAEGLGRGRIANTGAGLSDGSRAAFLDAQLSPEERDRVISALSHDPGDRAEMSSAAALLDSVDAEPSPLPLELAALAAVTFVKSAFVEQPGAVSGQHAGRRPELPHLVKSAADQAGPISGQRARPRPELPPPVKSAADQAAAIGRRAWPRPAHIALVSSLAALILLMVVVPGLLSLDANETPAPIAEPTGSAQPAAQSATTTSMPGAGGHAIESTFVLPPEPIESTRSIAARSETSAVCDDLHEEASCGSQAATETRAQPNSSHQSKDFGMVLASLNTLPDRLSVVAGRAVSLFGQLGKKTLALVDPRCTVDQHQMVAPRSRANLSTISRNNSNKPLPSWCERHHAGV
ncbi:MAG: hypothetical protein J2P54_20525 [Bradyrhizobiaceae bacterium]|nr:hypothetical protein [Bradyrhizobiaceae bacterium]